MRFFVFLLSVSVAIIQGNAQYQAYYRDSLYPSPVYQDIQPPNQENRIFFNQFYSAFTSFYTSTTTTTSTSTTTCTVSTNVACPGRRRRFTVGEQDDTIEASPVNQVEITQAADMKSVARTERKADPQFAFWRVDAEYPGHEPQSTFGQDHYAVNPYLYVRPPIVPGNARFFILQVTTVTSRTTTTSRSTPGCSSASSFNQC